MNGARRFLAAALLGLVFAAPASAYFEQTEAGARALAMGRAFVAVADDASAIYWNPAGLVQLEHGSVFLNHHRPYIVPDIAHEFAAVVWPTAAATVYGAWSHLGLSGVQSEDLLYLGAAREVWSHNERSIAIGGALKAARVSYSGAVATASDEAVSLDAKTKLTGDIGVFARLSPRLTAGWALRNAGRPRWDFIPGNGSTVLDFRQDLGAAFRWHEESVVSIALREGSEGGAVLAAGTEIEFYDVFALRFGLGDEQFFGGVGILRDNVHVDVGFGTHNELGITTVLSLFLDLGGWS